MTIHKNQARRDTCSVGAHVAFVDDCAIASPASPVSQRRWRITSGREDMATQRIRKTKLMRSVEEKHGRQLESLVPDLVNEMGMSRAASHLGVSPATLGYWMLKMGIQYRRVALADGETIEVRRQG